MKPHDVLFVGALVSLGAGVWFDRIDLVLYAAALTVFGFAVMKFKGEI